MTNDPEQTNEDPPENLPAAPQPDARKQEGPLTNAKKQEGPLTNAKKQEV